MVAVFDVKGEPPPICIKQCKRASKIIVEALPSSAHLN